MEIFLILIVLVFVFISHNSLSGRLTSLENKFKNQSVGEVKQEPVRMAESIPVPLPLVSAPDSNNYSFPSSSLKRADTVDVEDRLVEWLKEDWLMKLGVALFIIGFGWFVSYAFINNWIGPVGRISLGIVTGVIIIALGFKRMMRYPSQGAVFMALGAGMAMISIFAGRSVYGFFDPISAVMFDFIIAAFVSFASYKFNIKTLAFVAQVLAFLAPMLVAGNSNAVFLFSYLFFVSLATLLLAGMTGWRDLIVSSLIFVGIYSFPYFSYNQNSSDASTILNFAYLFSILYLFSGMFAVIKKGVQEIQVEIILAVLNGLFLFMWIYNMVPKDTQVLTFIFWGFVFAVVSFVTFFVSKQLSPFYAYGSVAIAFLAAATAAQLSGASLVIAFTLEVLLITIIVFLLTNNIKASVSASLLFIIPACMSLSSIFAYSISNDMFSKDFFVLLLLAICLIVAGRIITSYTERGSSETDVGFGFIVFGIIYLGYILWYFMHILINTDHDMATMTVLIIYTIFGLIAYFWGLYGNDMARRIYGVILLSFVVFRLIFIDVWNMQLFGRVITFLAIGILLMSTAFVTKNKRQEISHAEKLPTS